MSEDDWEDFGDAVHYEGNLEHIKAERDRLARQLYEVKHKHADYLRTVERAVGEAIDRIEYEPVSAPRQGRMGDGEEEVAVALLSDTQTGKITPDYNTEVCRARVMKYAEKIVEITEIQRLHHPVKHCVVPFLGDAVEGVDIFPGQQYLIDSTLYRQIFETTPSIYMDFLRYLLANFDTVTVYAVQGNHGRLGRRGQFGPEDNSDRMVYRLIKTLMAGESRLIFNMSDPYGERAWYQVMTIGNYRAMLFHGDQIKPVLGFPYYGLNRKVGGWASGGIPEQFDDVMMGHFHQLARIPLNKRVAWVNGSTESINTYASEFLAAASDPSQWLLYVQPERGMVTASYAIQLKDY